MTTTLLSKLSDRRAFLGLAMGAAATMIAGPALARAKTRSALPSRGGVRVDASGIAAKGLPNYARAVEAQLVHAFASLALQLPPGVTLLVHVTEAQLVSYAGGDFGPLRMGEYGESDTMTGSGTLVGPSGAVIATYPLLATLPAGSSGAWYLPDNEQRRLGAISLQFARWMAKGLGL